MAVGIAMVIMKNSQTQQKLLKQSEKSLTLQMHYNKIINSVNKEQLCLQMVGTYPVTVTAAADELTTPKIQTYGTTRGEVPYLVNGTVEVMYEPNTMYGGVRFLDASFLRTANGEVTFYFNFEKTDTTRFNEPVLGSNDKQYVYKVNAEFDGSNVITGCDGVDTALTAAAMDNFCTDALGGTMSATVDSEVLLDGGRGHSLSLGVTNWNSASVHKGTSYLRLGNTSPLRVMGFNGHSIEPENTGWINLGNSTKKWKSVWADLTNSTNIVASNITTSTITSTSPFLTP